MKPFDGVACAAASLLSFCTTGAGVMPEHGPGEALLPMQSEAVPALCGEAMLVPENVVVPPPSRSERMQTPGPAIVWLWSEADTAKFENSAYLSSISEVRHDGGPPVPPGSPSLSAIAVAVSTSLYAAGMKPASS